MPTSTPLVMLDDECADAVVTIRAVLRSVQLKLNKLGEHWASLQIAQAGHTATVLVFPRTFEATPTGVLHPDAVLHFDARVLRTTEGFTQLTPVSAIERAE